MHADEDEDHGTKQSLAWRHTDWGRHLIGFALDECRRGAEDHRGCPWITARSSSSSSSKSISSTSLRRRRLLELRGFSSVADLRCGDIKINRDNVTKCSLCKCKREETSAAGIPSAAAYHLEKLALCRLRRCVRPCGGRQSWFPRLLSWNDKHRQLVTSNAGVPSTATDIYGHKKSFSLVNVTDDARRRGLPSPPQQVHCMHQQLQDAGVVHLDITCKNLLVRDGALTLADFDAALIDGFPGPLLHPWGNPSRSDQPQRWLPSLCNRCFG